MVQTPFHCSRNRSVRYSEQYLRERGRCIRTLANELQGYGRFKPGEWGAQVNHKSSDLFGLSVDINLGLQPTRTCAYDVPCRYEAGASEPFRVTLLDGLSGGHVNVSKV